VYAVVVGIIILVIPFTIGCAFSVYAVYTLRESTLEEPDITNYAVIGDTEGQSAFPPARTEILSGSAVDSMQENASIHEKK
jgi:hypothetical protein